MSAENEHGATGLIARLRRRGVLRVAFSYAVIAWLVLQIGDVVLDPFDFGDAAMRVLLIVVALGFPVSLVLAWFFELTPSGIELDRQPPDEQRPAVTGIRRYADVLIIGLLVLVVAFLLAERGGLIDEAPGEAVVAVLPFENLSPEADDAYFGEGLADTLIHKLGQLNELVVLASQSTFQFRGPELDLEVVGARLGATVILLGSVQRAGDALRVNARLVDVASGQQLWSGSYDRALRDVFAVQDEIATAAAEALQLVLAPEAEARMTRPSTTILTAYDAYVLGISRLATRRNQDWLQAAEYFRQAIERDPEYALAHTGLVEALYLLGWRPWLGADWRDTAEEAARSARLAAALDPGLGEAWLARALVATNDREFLDDTSLSDDEIIGLYDKAIELSPNNAMAYKYFSDFYIITLDVENERSRELMERAALLDPRSGIIKVNIGESYARKGDLESALQWYRRAAYSQEPYFGSAYSAISNMYRNSGRLAEAARWGRAWIEAHPRDEQAYNAYLRVLMSLGAWQEMERVISELVPEVVEARGAVQGVDVIGWASRDYGMRRARAMGENEAAVSLAEELTSDYWQKDPRWPAVTHMPHYCETVATLALEDLRNGRAGEALSRYEAAFPISVHEMMEGQWCVPKPPVMMAGILRLTGNDERARTLLEESLAYHRDLPDNATQMPGGGNPNWSLFAVHAMRGETAAALTAMDAAIESGDLRFWWSLPQGAFDPGYAAVVADPGFRDRYERLTARVAEQRNAFSAQPELPEGYMR